MAPDPGHLFHGHREITEAQAHGLRVEQSQSVLVAADSTGEFVGTCSLNANSLTLGTHVAHAGYMVAEGARHRGIGTLPGAFRYRRLGYVDAYVMFREL